MEMILRSFLIICGFAFVSCTSYGVGGSIHSGDLSMSDNKEVQVFSSARHAEFNLGYFSGDSGEPTANGVRLGFNIIPQINISQYFSLFPLMGLSYSYLPNLENQFDDLQALNFLSLNLGGGFDISITRYMYLRSMFAYQPGWFDTTNGYMAGVALGFRTEDDPIRDNWRITARARERAERVRRERQAQREQEQRERINVPNQNSVQPNKVLVGSASVANVNIHSSSIIIRVTDDGYVINYDSETIGDIYFYIRINYADHSTKSFKQTVSVLEKGKGVFAIKDSRSAQANRREVRISNRNQELAEIFPNIENSTIVKDIDTALLKYSPNSNIILNNVANFRRTSRETQINEFYYPSAQEKIEIFGTMDTAVHEITHYFNGNGQFLINSEIIRLIRNSTIPWPKTEEVTGLLPESMRSFRWKTYVSPGATTGANPRGIYGLLGEFQAYYYGLKAVYDCFPFLKESGGYESKDFLLKYIGSLHGSISHSYYEFKWWILLYIDYLKENKPDLYRIFLNDREMIRVFLFINDSFELLVEQLIPERVNSLIEELNTIDGYFFYLAENRENKLYIYSRTEGRTEGRGLGDNIINAIRNELSTDKYKNMIAEFRKKI